jgi:uncharacterized membrane protein
MNAATGSEPERNTLLVVYILHALAIFNGLTAIIGVIISHLKVNEVSGDFARSHHRWLIRTFWWGLLWVLIATVLMVVGIGFLIYLVVWIWWIYRVVRGIINFSEHRPMPLG